MNWHARSLFVGILFAVQTISLAQPVLSWTSPTGTDSTLYGWIALRDTPLETRFYRITSSSIQLMSGPTNTTVSVTIPIVSEEWDFFQSYPTLYTDGDITGDGQNEIVITSMYGTTSPYRYGIRSVNPVTGANVIIFNSTSYSYYLYTVDDIDNDSHNEVIVMRYNYLITSNEYNYLVYTTPGTAVVADRASVSIPGTPVLHSNYPNPFNSQTKMRFSLPSPGKVKLSIIDNVGRVVKRYDFPQMSAGVHEVTWDGRNREGIPVSSGAYYSSLEANGTAVTEPMILVK